MPLNLLILPFLGGYLLVTRWRKTKWRVLRSDPQTQVLFSALAGIALLSVAVTIHWLFSLNPSFHRVISQTRQSVLPFDYAGRALLALLLAPLGVWLLNRYFADSEQDEKTREIMLKDDPLETFMHSAFSSKRMVMFSMKSGRVYVGFIKTQINPSAKRDHIVALLQLSGVREPSDGRFTPVVNYARMLGEIWVRLVENEDQIHMGPVAQGGNGDPDAYFRRIDEAALWNVLKALGLNVPKRRANIEDFMTHHGLYHAAWKAKILKALPDARWKEIEEDFSIVLPLSEIQSAHIFIPEFPSTRFTT